MKLRDVYHADGGGVEIAAEDEGKSPLVLKVLAMLFLLGGLLHGSFKPESPLWIGLALVALILLGFGGLRRVYWIQPEGRLSLCSKLYGLKLRQNTVSTSDFHTVEMKMGPDGIFTLRYDDAKGEEVFRFDQVPDIGVALKIAELIPVPEREPAAEAE